MNPLILGSVRHYGELVPFANYSVNQIVYVPKYISGNFRVMLHTDAQNNVFENYNDGNNVFISVTKFTPLILIKQIF